MSPQAQIAEFNDRLETQALSQEVVMMKDGAWVFLYNEVPPRSSPVKKAGVLKKGG